MITASIRSWALVFLLLFGLRSFAQAEILTFYGDAGLHSTLSTILDVYSGCAFPSGSAVLEGQTGAVTPPEGAFSAKLTAVNPSDCYFGWGAHFNAPQNLSRFNGGELRFWVRAWNGDIKVEIKNSAGTVVMERNLVAMGWGLPDANQWKLVRIPLAGVDLSSVLNPFLITALYGPGEFSVDDIHLVDFTGSTQFNVTVRNVNDQSLASDISWNSLTLPAGWVRANQYLEVEVEADSLSWGVQIYTDNTASGADPRFTSAVAAGQAGSNPAGLVDVVQTSKRIPLAWSVKGSTISAAVAANPDNNSDPNSFQWLYVADRATPQITSESTAAFVPTGVPYQIIKSNAGMHFGQAPTEFGAGQLHHPVKVYLQGNFSTAVTPRTYRTSTLTVEFFNL